MHRFLAFAALFIVGCSSSLSMNASKVEPVPQEAIDSNYVFLGTVTGTSTLTGVYCDAGYNNAMNICLEKAASMGATKIVIDPTCKATYWTTKEIVRAKAYKRKF